MNYNSKEYKSALKKVEEYGGKDHIRNVIKESFKIMKLRDDNGKIVEPDFLDDDCWNECLLDIIEMYERFIDRYKDKLGL